MGELSDYIQEQIKRYSIVENGKSQTPTVMTSDNRLSNALNRIYHLWARSNKDLFDGRAAFFDGAGHDAEGHGLHFMVMYHLDCEDIAELKTFILENSDEFAVTVREQIVLLHDMEEKMHESDDADS